MSSPWAGGTPLASPAKRWNTPTTDAPLIPGMKVWLGTVWVEKPVRAWDGTAWVVKPVRFWTGTAWSPASR